MTCREAVAVFADKDTARYRARTRVCEGCCCFTTLIFSEISAIKRVRCAQRLVGF